MQDFQAWFNRATGHVRQVAADSPVVDLFNARPDKYVLLNPLPPIGEIAELDSVTDELSVSVGVQLTVPPRKKRSQSKGGKK
jgi:hypothetical protein